LTLDGVNVRTTVGIVEWAARIARARALEMQLADTFGSWVPTVADPAAKTVLARHARHHAFHAALWDGVAPVLHDVVAPADPAGDRAFAPVVRALGSVEEMFADGLPALVAAYKTWAAQTSVVADRPVMRVLDLVLRDEEFDAAEGVALRLASP
jgi:hypothetical protein